MVLQKAVLAVLKGVLQKILPRNFAQTFSCSGVVMIGTAQTEILISRDGQTCSSIQFIQPYSLSLPPSPPQGVDEIVNKINKCRRNSGHSAGWLMEF